MSIAAVEAVPYALPFSEPYVTARGRLERREMVLVRLRTAEGIEGLGDAVAMSLRGGADTSALAREIGEVAGPGLIGTEIGDEPGPPAASVRDLSPAARGGLEIAWLDAAARFAEIPLWRLLGAESCRPVICNATLSPAPPPPRAPARRPPPGGGAGPPGVLRLQGEGGGGGGRGPGGGRSAPRS